MVRKLRILIAATPVLALAAVTLSLRASDARAGRVPSADEVRALAARVIANHHRNDAALEEYERLERRFAHKEDKDQRITEDKTFRVVPTGTGTLRLLIEEKGRKVSSAAYRKQLRDLEQVLLWALNPTEPKQKQRIEKWKRRTKERADLVDAVLDAFQFTWLGREEHNGRALVKLGLEPDPAFKPRVRNADFFSHVRATIWADEATAQLVRLEAEIIRDISFGGGVLGKVYRGGRFKIEQVEAAPGVWLPALYEYDFEGRKFLFGFETHEHTEIMQYRRIGPPKEALAAIRRELSNTPPAESGR